MDTPAPAPPPASKANLVAKLTHRVRVQDQVISSLTRKAAGLEFDNAILTMELENLRSQLYDRNRCTAVAPPHPDHRRDG